MKPSLLVTRERSSPDADWLSISSINILLVRGDRFIVFARDGFNNQKWGNSMRFGYRFALRWLCVMCWEVVSGCGCCHVVGWGVVGVLIEVGVGT